MSCQRPCPTPVSLSCQAPPGRQGPDTEGEFKQEDPLEASRAASPGPVVHTWLVRELGGRVWRTSEEHVRVSCGRVGRRGP